MIRFWRVPAVIAAVVLAGLLAFEARALTSARTANERDAARSLLILSGTTPRGGRAPIAQREQALLGLRGVPALREAIDAIGRSKSSRGHDNGRAIHQAEQILDRIVKSDEPTDTRSQAANLLGALALIEGLSSKKPAEFAKATRMFRQALAFGPENESAKFNLELVLSMPGNRSKARSASTKTSTSGTGSDGAGTGY